MGSKPHDDEELEAILKEKAEEIRQALKLGLSIGSACRAAGISDCTYYNWRKKARDGILPYAEIFEYIRTGFAEGERTLAGRVFEASEKDWRAGMAILERRHKKRWGKEPAIVNTNNNANVNSTDNMTFEERLNRIEELKRKLGSLATPGKDEAETESTDDAETNKKRIRKT